MSKRPLVYWNILGEGARKASNANIDTSPKITINFLEEVGALQDVIVVGRRGVCRFLKAAGCGAQGRSAMVVLRNGREKLATSIQCLLCRSALDVIAIYKAFARFSSHFAQ